ncbi:unnamed protein product [Caenorhabditis angaria]|uniref:Uncharacterized protein n=1 Tax=Caenorhabditis angaria TaxID=860376 RepID=A0A9P1IEV3_9PELO|nr:unnamed protein product [Caenorhabditis angaria]
MLFVALIAYASYSFHIFIPIAPTNSIECHKMINSSSEYYLNYFENRTILNATENDKNCFQIRRRRYLPTDMPKTMAGNHNMFFIRVVSKDYDFVEEVLTMMHSPLHFFCFVLDQSSEQEFRERMHRLGDCMVNVLVPRETFDITTSHGLLKAHKRCLTEIDAFEWKHVIITSEYDIPLHSTKYLARRSRRLRDSFEINGETFKEDTLLHADPKNQTSHLFKVTKNWIQHLGSTATISHSQHDRLYKYLFKTPNFVLPSENNKELIVLEKNCKSSKYDIDGSCIHGMEDYPHLRSLTRLFIRADPNFDNGFIECVHEVIFERTYFDPISNSNSNNYLYGSGHNSIENYRV